MTANDPDRDWLQIKLPGTTEVSKIVITGRGKYDYLLKTTNVYLSDTPYSDGVSEEDLIKKGLKGQQAPQAIVLDPTKTGKYIIFKQTNNDGYNSIMQVAEVEVYGKVIKKDDNQNDDQNGEATTHVVTKNIARYLAKASEGSNFNGQYPASNAIDDSNATFNYTTDDNTKNWLQLQLPGVVKVSKVVVLGRSGAIEGDEQHRYEERLMGTKVYLMDSSYSGSFEGATLVGTLDGVAEAQELTPSSEAKGKYLVLKADNTYLHIANLEVFGSIEISTDTKAGTKLFDVNLKEFDRSNLQVSLDNDNFSIDKNGNFKLAKQLSAGVQNVTIHMSDGVHTTDLKLVFDVAKAQTVGDGVPVITLKGQNPMTVEQGKEFVDPGATAEDKEDGKVEVTVEGEVDTSTVGTYTLTYTAKDKDGHVTKKTRTVKVVAAAKADVAKGPYLVFDHKNTEMEVVWQLESTQECSVDWGSGSGTSTEGVDHVHAFTITGLTPGEHYEYTVTCDNGTVGSGSFTAAPADDATSVTLFAYGDTRSQPSIHDKLAKRMIEEYKNDPASQTLVLHSGDWVSDGGREYKWDDQYFDPSYKNMHELQATMPIVGTPGNHMARGLSIFKKYFPVQYAGSRGVYRSFDYGPAHIVLIDQYYARYSTGSEQYKWLENDLKNSSKKWKILVFHAPGWTVEGHHNNNSDVQRYIQPLAKKYGVSLIINGHNHFYARAMVDGVAHITSGGGGAPLYSLSNSSRDRENIVKAKKTYQYCKIAIDGNKMVFKAIDINGNVIDTYETTK